MSVGMGFGRVAAPADGRVEVLLFDLGGVLVDFTGVAGLTKLLRSPIPLSEVQARLASSELLRAFEIGQLTPEVFATRFVDEWSLEVSSTEFLGQFRTWSHEMFPGARELLANLAQRYRVAALSNSNEVHWDRNASDLRVQACFELAMSSHQLGLHKPDPAIFRQAARLLGVSAERIAFFDDAAANVSGARSVGMVAHHVQGLPALLACLQDGGYLRSDSP